MYNNNNSTKDNIVNNPETETEKSRPKASDTIKPNCGKLQ